MLALFTVLLRRNNVDEVIVPVVRVVPVAPHDQDVGVHGLRHALGVLHNTPPVHTGGPPGFTQEAGTTGAGVGVHPGPVVVPQTVPRGAVLVHLTEALTHPSGPVVSVARHEATAAHTVNVVAARVTGLWLEHQALSPLDE